MGIFDKLFKKDKPTYDVTDLRVTDLKKKFIFDYDLSSWEVTAEYTYDWGDNYFSKEFKIQSDKETLYLSVEDDDELEICISKKIKISKLDINIISHFRSSDQAPDKLSYKGEDYFLEEESPGFFKDESKNDSSWEELISWDYISENSGIITLEQWGENDFEASAGQIIKEFEISNIIPNN